jgi:hypothetical protein
MARSFDAHLDMANLAVASADRFTVDKTSLSLLAHLRNALSQVIPTGSAFATLGEVELALGRLGRELRRGPLETRTSKEANEAKRAVQDQIEAFRSELKHCEASPMALMRQEIL